LLGSWLRILCHTGPRLPQSGPAHDVLSDAIGLTTHRHPLLIWARNLDRYDRRHAMQIEVQPFVAATLAFALLAACGERAEEETPAAAAPAAAEQTTQTTNAQGTTTTFGESAAEPQQPPAQ
jgi:uncharacterized protein RhaS with RHS repeats